MHFRTLPVVCATALVVHWNYLYTFVQKGADLKVHDVYGVAFPNVSSAFNEPISALRLMYENSDLNIPDLGKRTVSYFALCDNSRCISTWCATEQHFKIVRNLILVFETPKMTLHCI